MARVTMPDGRTFDIDDGNAALERYYIGEGATITAEPAAEGQPDGAPELSGDGGQPPAEPPAEPPA